MKRPPRWARWDFEIMVDQIPGPSDAEWPRRGKWLGLWPGTRNPKPGTARDQL